MPQSWFSIKNISDENAEVNIYDEIGYFGISAKDFLTELANVGNRKITLRINSPGGSVFDGTAIYNRLKDHAPGVDVKIDGLAASIASVIAMAGSKITMAENALLMIHNASGVAMGNADDMRQLADTLDKIDGTIAGTYARKTGRDASEMSALMDSETWFTAAEALAGGFIDEIDEPIKVAAKFSGSIENNFKNKPTPEVLDFELAINNAIVEIDNLKTQLSDLSAERDTIRSERDAQSIELTTLRAQVEDFTAKEKRAQELVALLKASQGIAPAAVVPAVDHATNDQPSTLLRSEFNALSYRDRAAFMARGGKLTDTQPN